MHRIAPAASPALHPDWMLGWLRHYGPAYVSEGAIRTYVVRDDGALVGLIPMYIANARILGVRVRTLRFLSTGEDEAEETCADYLNLLAAPGREAEVLPVIERAVFGAHDWQVLDLTGVPSESALLRLGDESGLARFRKVESRGECLRSDITNGVEGLLAKLSAKARQKSRRLLREFQRSGLQFKLAEDAPAIEAAFDDLVALHTARWTADGKAGAFASRRFLALHRELARKWIPEGRAALATLRDASRPLAVIYGFIERDEFHFYQSGATRDRLESIASPGIAINLLLMDALSQRGIAVYDFLLGQQQYKQEYRTSGRSLTRLRLVRDPRLRALEAFKSWIRPIRRGAFRRRGSRVVRDSAAPPDAS